MQLRRVEEGEIALWARVTVASLQRGKQTEAEIAEAFAGQSEAGQREAYLAWNAERAVGRLRMRLSGELCDVWAAGLLPEAGADGPTRRLAAIEANARAAGARRMVLELRPGKWEGTALRVDACYAAGYRLWKRRTQAERGIAEMHLMVTLGNVPTEGLYRRMGFVEVPDTVQYNLEKEIV